MIRQTWWFGIVFIALSFVATTSLSAQTAPKEMTPDFSTYAELTEIAEELDELWHKNPDLFRQLDATRQEVNNWYAQNRHRPANVARMLEGLGEEGLLPMLWALAADNPMQLQMGLQAWRSWRVGLLEAVGRLRDERSIPVLKAIIAGNEPHAPIHQVATSALGRIGDIESIDAVIDIARSSPDKRDAIVAGLGQARRHNAVEYLLEVFETGDDAEIQRTAVRAMGDWTNQWAWETATRQDNQDEGRKGRAATINALVDAYPEADDGLQKEIAKSLQLAGAAASKELLVDRAEASDDDRRRALWTGLADKMADSPMQ